MKSKFASLKANIHTQVNKSWLQQPFATAKFQQLLAATKFQQLFAASKWLSLFQGISIHTANTQNQADPYICLRLVPNSRFWKQLSASNWDLFVVRFSDTPKHRTQTQRRTLFPLFDETFDLWVQSFFFNSTFMAISFQLCVWGSQEEGKCLPADSGQGSWAYGPGFNICLEPNDDLKHQNDHTI